MGGGGVQVGGTNLTPGVASKMISSVHSHMEKN